MVRTPLPLIEKNSLIQLQMVLPRVLARQVTQAQMMSVCALFRRMGISQLFLSGLPDGFFEELSRSARAFLFFLQGTDDAAKTTSRSEPYFDAIACGDTEAEREIAQHSRATWSPGEEYEDDFLYVRILMEHFTLAASPDRLDAAMRRYERLPTTGDDVRLALCQALVTADAQRFEEGLGLLLEVRTRELRKRLEAERLSPDDATTTAHLSVEVLALLRLAERAGLPTEMHYPLAPSVARRLDRARLPPPASWQQRITSIQGTADAPRQEP
ncbi:Imm49 family immunity protein [Myxococcus vastator]|uniref:Imm49 family immunity protein n=1 Tax=Myxococcus vastator TaxID=2709664 RepID=UPI0013D42841|nr:Imm49 family immunity protein [Myxococcus vastator]